jgi:hypothetical protein
MTASEQSRRACSSGSRAHRPISDQPSGAVLIGCAMAAPAGTRAISASRVQL